MKKPVAPAAPMVCTAAAFRALTLVFVQPPGKDERAFDDRFVFDGRYPIVQGFGRVVRHDAHFFLHEDRSRVAAGIDEVHGAAAFFFARGDDRFVYVPSPHAFSAEFRKQGGM